MSTQTTLHVLHLTFDDAPSLERIEDANKYRGDRSVRIPTYLKIGGRAVPVDITDWTLEAGNGTPLWIKGKTVLTKMPFTGHLNAFWRCGYIDVQLGDTNVASFLDSERLIMNRN